MKKFAEKIRAIGLVANTDKPLSRGVVRQAATLITERGLSVLTDLPTARLAGLEVLSYQDLPTLARKSDVLLVFGGDGTMLRVARGVAGCLAPILGINVGGLGFLTAVPSKKLPAALGQIWAGAFSFETRPLMEATGKTGTRALAELALNDFTISRGTISRMIELQVSVDGEILTRYRCDGLIVSSPTGSTAYSLAAGGAVVTPSAEVFALTPICPHTLSNRSVIVSLASTVRVKVLSKKLETVLTADGQLPTALAAGDQITIRRSRRAIRLMQLEGTSFFETLRQKLNWSGSNV